MRCFAVLPQVVEHREGGGTRLRLRREAAQVDDGRIGLVVDVVGDAPLAPRPEIPVGDAQVLQAHRELMPERDPGPSA